MTESASKETLAGSIAPSLLRPSIILCTSKPERAVGLQNAMTQQRIAVHVCVTLSETLRMAGQILPYVIAAEADLSDGSVVQLFDLLAKHEVLRDIPIAVLAARKSRDELVKIAVRKFAKLFAGNISPAAIAQALGAMTANGSPQTYKFKALEPDFLLKIEAEAIGKVGQHLAIWSQVDVPATSAITIVPKKGDFKSGIFKNAVNLPFAPRGKEAYRINLFPIQYVRSAAAKWIMDLASLDAGKEQKSDLNVLVWDPRPEGIYSAREVLQGYGYRLHEATSLEQAATMLKASKWDLVFLDDLMGQKDVAVWGDAYRSLPEEHRPPLISTTKNMPLHPPPRVFFLRQPYSFGQLVNQFECAARIWNKTLASGKPATSHMPVFLEARATPVLLDESGLIIKSTFALLPGARLEFANAFLREIWGQSHAVVIDSAPDPKNSGLWQSRLDQIGHGNTARLKDWERMLKALAGNEMKRA